MMLNIFFALITLIFISLIDCDKLSMNNYFHPDAKVTDHRTFMNKVLKKKQLPSNRPTLFDTIVIIPKDDPTKSPDEEPSTTTTTKLPRSSKLTKIFTTKATTKFASSTVAPPDNDNEEVNKEILSDYHHNLDKYAFKILNESMSQAIEQCKEYHCGIKVDGEYHFRSNDDYHVVEMKGNKLKDLIRDACASKVELQRNTELNMRNIPHQLLDANWNIDGDIFFRKNFDALRHLAVQYEDIKCPKENSKEEIKLVEDVTTRLNQLVAVKEFRDMFKVKSFRIDPWPGITFEKESINNNVSWKCNRASRILKKVGRSAKKNPDVAFILTYFGFIFMLMLL